MAAILVAHSDERRAAQLATDLGQAGFACDVVATGDDAVAAVATAHHDLLLLDLALSGDGFWVLTRLRASGNDIPVIILTAEGSATDTVVGLERGADDVLSEPIGADELLARIRARLRPEPVGRVGAGTLRHGRLTLDLVTRRASSAHREASLSARESALLETFLRRPGRVLSREELLAHVWGYDFDPGSNVVDVYVRYLRIKLGASTIRTVRGAGYRLGD